MLGWFAESTLISAGLAALVALACRWRRLGPEARHALWLVVMIKLAIPPVVAWPSLSMDFRPEPPSPSPVARPEPAPTLPEPPAIPDPSADPWPDPSQWAILPPPPGESQISGIPDFRQPELEPEPEPAARSPRVPSTNPVAKAVPPRSAIWDRKSAIRNLRSAIPQILLGFWLAGTVGVVAFRAAGLVRFRRSIRDAIPPPPRLSEEARSIGDRLGVRPPPILVTSGVTTPLLWCLGRPRLILPASLVDRLGADQWPGILAHELAHLARRDHWVIRLELLVELVWWWNPVFHLTRRRLRVEAEQAADARVIRALPDRRFAYAEALVDICEHLSRSAIPSPALGVGGAEASRTLEARLLMILRDPIPRPPRRRAILAAGLLAALALPSWTLGQQPDPPPVSATPAPDVPKAADEPDSPAKADEAAQPSTPLPTPDEIRAGYAKRLEDAARLGFRYSVASRSRIGVGLSQESVRIQVADMVLDSSMKPPLTKLRLDVLSASDPGRSPSQDPGAFPWIRRFVARDGLNFVTLGGPSTQEGPVPFRWRTTDGQGEYPGDDLTAELLGNGTQKAVNPDNSIDPLDPRPANVLDLAGGLAQILQLDAQGSIRAYLAGGEVIDGREAARIAWVTRQNFGTNPAGLRGLIWVVPSLGFAVVRSEAAQDSTQVGMMHGRRFWRKSAGDFVEVDGLWLPRKVEARFVEMSAPQGGQPINSRDLVATFEDYRVNPVLPDDIFHPTFPIEALDEKTGDFTTRPPALAPGLVERFRKAVAESPYGPPGVRAIPGADRAQRGNDRRDLIQEFNKSLFEYARLSGRGNDPNAPEVREAKQKVEELRARLKAAASQPKVELPAAARPTPSPEAVAPPNPNPGRPNADIVTNVDEAPITPEPVPASRLATPEPVPASRLEGPAPEAEPSRANPAPADAPLTEERIAQLVESRFRDDPEVIALARQMMEARERRDQIRRTQKVAGDPAERKAHEKVQRLEGQYERLWEIKSRQIREELNRSESPLNDLALLQNRRDSKANELKKAEFQHALEGAEIRQSVEQMKGEENPLAREAILKAESKLRIIDAEIENRRAELAEADFVLNRERRRRGFDPGPEPPMAAALPASGGSLADLRDAVELMEVQLQGKRAEERGEEAKLGAAQSLLTTRRQLHQRAAISQGEVLEAEFGLKSAEAQLAQKQAEVREFEVRLKQAQRRVAAEEARISRAIPRAKERLEWAEAMKKKGYVSASQVEDARSQYEELNRQLGPTPAPATPETSAKPE